MIKSKSESFLQGLAERTFLKLWAIPNTFYAPGKELTDLIVPFGDDVIIISDKACYFDVKINRDLAWSRWYSRSIKDSVRQLRTAKQRIERQPDKIFIDSQANQPLPLQFSSCNTRRYHLVAIARPDLDPSSVPPHWPGLTYVSDGKAAPFRIGELQTAGQIVHIFDGSTIDLLLKMLDTAPDFIAYLNGRAQRMLEADEYEFFESDLLAATLIGYDFETGILPTPPPLEVIIPGIWESFILHENAERRQKADAPSQIIDAFIERHHKEYVGERFLYEKPTFKEHEYAMRLLAAESRFARRIIAHELHDILKESDQSTFWASTVPSPTVPHLRYVWLTYPKRTVELTDEVADHFLIEYLQKYVFVAQGLFDQTLVLGICLPNREANDTAEYVVVHDGSSWSDEDRVMALELRKDGIFDQLETNNRTHIR